MPTLSINKKARYDYTIMDTMEAGIQLTGAEVKSVRGGRLNLAGSRVVITRGEAYLLGAQIAAYSQAGAQPGYDPQRTRRLLLHMREIRKLIGKLEEAGLTVVPLSAYTKGRTLSGDRHLRAARRNTKSATSSRARSRPRSAAQHDEVVVIPAQAESRPAVVRHRDTTCRFTAGDDRHRWELNTLESDRGRLSPRKSTVK